MTAASNSESRKRNVAPADPVEIVARAINPDAFEFAALWSIHDARENAARAVAALRAEGLLND